MRNRRSGGTLGLVVIFPAMLGLALLVLFLGRQVDTRSQVQAAADAAAQAAALQRFRGRWGSRPPHPRAAARC